MTEFVLAKEADAVVVAGLRQKGWAATYRGIFPDGMIDRFDYPWHAERDLKRIQSTAYLVWLIQEDGQNGGYLILKKGQPLLLNSLYLLPEFQRRGIGRQAFGLIRSVCRETGAETFICHCQPRNENALAFYHAMGGRVISRDEGNEEAWQDAVILEFDAKEETT